jgi:cytochrome c peroxidase
VLCLEIAIVSAQQQSGAPAGLKLDGKHFFETETFGGNGRTCRTCHSLLTGTVPPEDAAQRFALNPNDPLFMHDGSDDGYGNGATRMLTDATVLVTINLAANVSLAADPTARTVTLRRGIPTTLNSPALDPIIMLDGRQASLESQAAGALADHAQVAAPPFAVLHEIAEFQRTNDFFTSPAVRRWALGAGGPPELPEGRTASEKRGRFFFEDVPADPGQFFKPGLCSHCHSGPLLNQTNQFASGFIGGLPIPAGQRFLSVGVSEFNPGGNPVREFIFDKGTAQECHLFSPDPGRSLITGIANDPTLEHVNAFKIAPLRPVVTCRHRRHLLSPVRANSPATNSAAPTANPATAGKLVGIEPIIAVAAACDVRIRSSPSPARWPATHE